MKPDYVILSINIHLQILNPPPNSPDGSSTPHFSTWGRSIYCLCRNLPQVGPPRSNCTSYIGIYQNATICTSDTICSPNHDATPLHAHCHCTWVHDAQSCIFDFPNKDNPSDILSVLYSIRCTNIHHTYPCGIRRNSMGARLWSTHRNRISHNNGLKCSVSIPLSIKSPL